MQKKTTLARLAAIGVALQLPAAAMAQPESSLASRPGEPLRAQFSAALAAEGLDAIPRDWKDTACLTCHLQHSYLMARPVLSTNSLGRHRPTSLHQKAMLMLAAQHVAGIVTAEQRQQTIADLCAAQTPDGGWSSASLLAPGDRPSDTQTRPSSDGYATGFVIYVLREAGGLPAGDPRIRQGVVWLKTHQRASGRWFTPSLSGKNRNVISLEGTAWAVLALGTCGELAEPEHQTDKK